MRKNNALQSQKWAVTAFVMQNIELKYNNALQRQKVVTAYSTRWQKRDCNICQSGQTQSSKHQQFIIELLNEWNVSWSQLSA